MSVRSNYLYGRPPGADPVRMQNPPELYPPSSMIKVN